VDIFKATEKDSIHWGFHLIRYIAKTVMNTPVVILRPHY